MTDRASLVFGGRIRLFLVALSIFLVAGLPAHAQAPAMGPAKGGPVKQPGGVAATRPAWSELTPAQQAALGPLAPAWGSISEAQKRKWIALSQNYPSLAPAERATLHGRMTEWAALSPAQRNQARLNFAETKRLTNEEKKAQWQAYQALTPEQKKLLAAQAETRAAGAAPAVTPTTRSKLAAVPVTRSEAAGPVAAASRPRPGRQDRTGPKIVGTASAPVARP
jgi:hypothetical protein